MSKFTFVCENPDLAGNVKSKITYETEEVVLDSVIEDFEAFLRGCGFYLDGHLEIQQTSPADNVNHSEFFYDFDRNR